jgi:hypothetical protein
VKTDANAEISEGARTSCLRAVQVLLRRADTDTITERPASRGGIKTKKSA